MPEPLDTALAEVRDLLLRRETLVRAVAAGRRRGAAPAAVRVELRPIVIKAGARLQVVRHDGVRPQTSNLDWGTPATAVVDDLLAEPFGNWHVESTGGTLQLRVTKRGEAQVHRSPGPTGAPPGSAGPAGGSAGRDVRPAGHDRVAAHLLPPSDPLYDVIGGSAAKRRQVDAFLRALAATLDGGAEPTPHRLSVVDLGCGNAYLTFAAYRYLAGRGLDLRVTGVDVRDDQRARNTALARDLGCADRVRFVAGTIAGADVGEPPDVVLALHACDTATDEALARAVRWRARWVLAAPCCHHDVAAQLRRAAPAPGQRALVRDGILRERFADVLTDALRAALLRRHGYRVDVVEFVDSTHTPRNVLLRARRTGPVGPAPGAGDEYRELAAAWGVRPALERLLAEPDGPGGEPD